jgi:CheY-like chemotaxis protein
VAEDNQINRLYIVELIKMLGCTCDVVENGAEVLPALKRAPYDLVLMDCQMPIMDGFTASREVRKHEEAHPGTGHIPIVALTANALQGDHQRCLDAGMDDYVKKPIDGDQLRTVLEKMLRATRASSKGRF